MSLPADAVRLIDLSQITDGEFTIHCADSIVLTHDRKILLQRRGGRKPGDPDRITAFGGHIDPGETPLQGVMRELNEELGAQPVAADMVSLGAITEAQFEHAELVHTYFWHDRHRTITGCYEHLPILFTDADAVCRHPCTLDYVKWMLRQCHERGLLAIS